MKYLIFLISMVSICFSLNIAISQTAEDGLNKEDLINYVEVKKADIDLAGKSRHEIDNMLFGIINFSYRKQFNGLTMENWLKQSGQYKATLINKANQLGFDGKNLEKCLDKITKSKGTAILPIGASLAKFGPENIWIIACVWENRYDDNQKRSLGHDLAYAVKASNQEVIGFTTCD